LVFVDGSGFWRGGGVVVRHLKRLNRERGRETQRTVHFKWKLLTTFLCFF
jgi:hypothetical protein